MRPEVTGWKKNFENWQKHQKRRSACVVQGDFGKVELNNIRNDGSNSQRLSVLSVRRDQFETRSIRNKPPGGTLRISGWGCAAGTLEPLTCTRASSAEFCYPIPE